jgi:hypothetical protein
VKTTGGQAGGATLAKKNIFRMPHLSRISKGGVFAFLLGTVLGDWW